MPTEVQSLLLGEDGKQRCLDRAARTCSQSQQMETVWTLGPEAGEFVVVVVLWHLTRPLDGGKSQTFGVIVNLSSHRQLKIILTSEERHMALFY